MIDDVLLLEAYAAKGDEAAFRELVERHLPMVYSAALRQVAGDQHLAKDVAQDVFHDFARKAPKLMSQPVVAGWLYRATILSSQHSFALRRTATQLKTPSLRLYSWRTR